MGGYPRREAGHGSAGESGYRARIASAGSDMLFLSAILRVWVPREPAANDLLAEARLRLGHVGLTIIALVYVLVSFWQR